MTLSLSLFIMCKEQGESASLEPPAPQHLPFGTEQVRRCSYIFEIRLEIKMIAMSENHTISIRFFQSWQVYVEKITIFIKFD